MYGRRFWSCDQHEVEKTMPMFSQGIVTPVRESGWWLIQQRSFTWCGEKCTSCYWQQQWTHQAQHQDGAEWIQSYWEGHWGSIHACSDREKKRAYSSSIFINSKTSSHLAQTNAALTWRRVRTCTQGSRFHVCLCLLSHNALLHGSPSAPLSANNLAI